jgi:hypothetical protein
MAVERAIFWRQFRIFQLESPYAGVPIAKPYRIKVNFLTFSASATMVGATSKCAYSITAELVRSAF